MKTRGIDTHDLRRIFLLTAAVSVLVFLVSLPFSSMWAFRYGLLSALAFFNWIALAAILSGISRRNPLQVLAGASLKPLLLGLLLVYALTIEIEITSFLAGLNTFFVCLAVYMVGRPILRNRIGGTAILPSIMGGTSYG